MHRELHQNIALHRKLLFCENRAAFPTARIHPLVQSTASEKFPELSRQLEILHPDDLCDQQTD